MTVYDISQSMRPGMVIYPGDPKFQLRRFKQPPKSSATVSEIQLGVHTGTHFDAPRHFIRNGKTYDKFPLSRFYGPAIVVDCTKVERTISSADVPLENLKKGWIVLFKTKNSFYRGTSFNKNFVHISPELAVLLVKRGITTIGTDGQSIEQFKSPDHSVHKTLLTAGVIIYEGLVLKNVKPGCYAFFGLPLPIENAEASPVRAILID